MTDRADEDFVPNFVRSKLGLPPTLPPLPPLPAVEPPGVSELDADPQAPALSSWLARGSTTPTRKVAARTSQSSRTAAAKQQGRAADAAEPTESSHPSDPPEGIPSLEVAAEAQPVAGAEEERSRIGTATASLEVTQPGSLE